MQLKLMLRNIFTAHSTCQSLPYTSKHNSYFGFEELCDVCVVAVVLFVVAALLRSSHLLIFRFGSGADASAVGADFLTPFWNSTYMQTFKNIHYYVRLTAFFPGQPE